MKFQVNWTYIQEKWLEIDFQDGNRGIHLGFSIGTILAVYDLLVPLILPIKFQINQILPTILTSFDLQVTLVVPTMFPDKWPFGSREQVQNRFSRWGPFLISNWNDFN